MRLFFTLMTIVSLGFWVLGYVGLILVDCMLSFGGACNLVWPWELTTGQEVVKLFVMPGLVTALFFGLAIWAYKKRQKKEKASFEE